MYSVLKLVLSPLTHSATNLNYKTPHWLGSNTELTSKYKQVSSSVKQPSSGSCARSEMQQKLTSLLCVHRSSTPSKHFNFPSVNSDQKIEGMWS